MDVRSPELSLFDFPLRQAAEAKRDAEFVAPVLATPTADLRGMVRGEGSIESQRAATDVRPSCAAIRARILKILETEGPQTAGELERRAEFAHCGVCTVRKRVTESKQAGQIVQVGRRDGMAVWDIRHE